MAALLLQSRFAGLKIEDDDIPNTRETQRPKKKTTNTSKEVPKKTKNNNKSQNGQKKKKGKPVAPTEQQWEEWKEKDGQLAEGNYETQLEQAMILSKLDFEAKKDVYKLSKKAAEQNTKPEQSKGSKKQKKKNVMSLEQFNDMVTNGDDPKAADNPPSGRESPEHDPEFFERVKEEIRAEILKDKGAENAQRRTQVSHQVINRLQFAEAIEKKEIEMAALKEEVDGLKDELLTVKSRNIMLCSILAQAEMKEKAEVLVEVERLRGVQSELTVELETLHSELERERSRNTDSRTKDRKKKGGSSEK